MASKAALQRRCDSDNSRNRMVDEVRNQNMDAFWRSSQGSFFITGDPPYQPELRRQMLIRAIQNAPGFSEGPLIVIHNDNTLEEQMIKMAKADELTRVLVVTNTEHKNYQPFYGMPRDRVLACLNEMARMNAYHNIASIDAYAKAFIEIVSATYPVSLQSMYGLVRHTDPEIEGIASRSGVAAGTLQAFHLAADGSLAFRVIIDQMWGALSQISFGEDTENPTKFNMITESGRQKDPRIILLNRNTTSPQVFHIYLKYELQAILERPVSVILHDVPLNPDDGVMEALKNIAMRQGSFVGLCASDIFNLAQMGDLNNFPAQCIFQHGNQHSLQTLLDSFGVYDYEYVTEGVGMAGGRLFDLLPAQNFHIAHDSGHPRIMLSDMNESLAVLKATNGVRVTITDGLR